MAYETGASTSVNDLLTKIATFASAQGWTINYNGARTSGTGNAVQLSKNGYSFTFYSDTATLTGVDPKPWIGCYAHDAYSAGNGTENQANGSSKSYTNNMAGPFVAYHFFAGDTYFYVIVEVSTGVFKHLGIGVLTKFGTVTTGQFIYAVNWYYNYNSGANGYLSLATDLYHRYAFDEAESGNGNAPYGTQFRADNDSTTPKWCSPFGRATAWTFWGGVRSNGQNLNQSLMAQTNNPSAYTQRTTFQQCLLASSRTGGFRSICGYPPNVRYANMTNFTAGDVVTFGAEQWKLFPVIRKNGAAGEPNSGVYGYAFLL